MTDAESGQAFEVSRSDGDDVPPYFWTRPKIYVDEWRPFLSIPVGRGVLTVVNVYIFIYTCIFVASLCTDFAKFTVMMSVIGGCTYLGWATWWDETYAFPITWSCMKQQHFNAFWTSIWLLYSMIQIMIVLFMCVAIMAINYVDFKDAFKFECF